MRGRGEEGVLVMHVCVFACLCVFMLCSIE